MGYCSDGWWLNQNFCCWEIEGDETVCESWHPWSEVTVARWTIYILFAVSYVPCCYSNINFVSTGRVLVHCCSLSQIFGKVSCRLWYLRNQSHISRIQYEGLPRICHMGHQEYNAGMPVSSVNCSQWPWHLRETLASSYCIRPFSWERRTLRTCRLLYRIRSCNVVSTVFS